MKLYSKNNNYKLYQGNMLDMLEVIKPNSIDSIITDPPYGLTSMTKRFGKEDSAECQYGKDGSFQRLSKGFMGKEWDGSGIEYNVDAWQKCYEVLKPGGYLLAFGGSRTFHRIACAIEDAGFEIRDTIMWLYGSGFPKSLNIGLALDKKNGVESIDTGIQSPNARPNCDKTNTLYESGTVGKEFTIKKATNKWEGWGTALKPSFEPIIVARKPFKSSLVDNVIEYGVGGINIDECRVGNEIIKGGTMPKMNSQSDGINLYNFGKKDAERLDREDSIGRFPANTILTYDETEYDTTSWLRYFYCAKASKKDRDEGLDNFETKAKVFNGKSNESSKEMKDVEERFTTLGKNTHPTVKPTDLMQYLVRLVSPNGATILDPFNGSGSTGKAVMYENRERNKNYKYIGIELTEEYLPIAKARIEYVCNLPEEKDNQMTIFDFIGDEENE